MLQSLYIKNFRNLEDFKIKSLEHVNLITGKNNTGKSTILEALELYGNEGDSEILIRQLENRNEFDRRNSNNLSKNVTSFASVFTGRVIDFDNNFKIETVSDRFLGTNPKKNTLRIALTKYVNTIEVKNEVKPVETYTEICLKITFGNTIKILNLENPLSQKKFKENHKNNTQFINQKLIENTINSQLWDKITLTDKEQYVIEALKIIEPKVQRIAFIEGYRNERLPVIKIQGEKQVLPLKSMGDGINRILTIILALVNAEGGMLLIDEFENGLHYTVQEQLWKMIFLLAEELDIQVFATTHSEDCLRGFENVLNDYNIATNGKLIRLDRKGDKIVQVEFDKEELKVATDFDIEIR